MRLQILKKRYLFFAFLLGSLFFSSLSIGATVLFPSGGGTGTSTAPTAGYLLMGAGGGKYTFVASSSVGGVVSFANVSSTNIDNTGYITNAGVLTQKGIIIATGTVPTLSSCGTDPSIVGTNLAGIATVGSGITTSCTLNFSVAYANAPSCTIDINTSAVGHGVETTASTAIFTFAASVAGGKIQYHCLGL